MPLLSSLALQARRRRFALLLQALGGHAWPVKVLDVGGTLAYWQSMPPVNHVRLTLLNLEAESVPDGVVSLQGDACDLSRFPDQSFDVVFSNSVIGHVGDAEHRQRMAAELQRVGKTVVLQTPNKWFPFDWHTQMPCFHWLPVSLQALWHRYLPTVSYPRATDAQTARRRATRIHHLTARELRQLFPGATLVRERVFGITKSFVVTTPHHRNSYAPMSQVPSAPRVVPSRSNP